MEFHHDILIIGSGMGGLVSAVILAKEGFDVCLIEKNRQFGGNLQTFSRDKTIFDTGVHYLGGLEKGQNLYLFFKYLEIIDDLPLSKMNENAFDYITFDNDEKKYPHAQEHDNFVKQLSKFFPEEKANLQAYCKKLQEICDDFPLYNLEEKEVYNTDILSLNLKDYLDNLTDNEKLKSVLAGSSLLYGGNEKTPLYVHALSVNSYIQSAWRIVKGGSQITKLLIKKLRKYGGSIHKKTEAVDFNFEGNTLKSVKAKNGKTFYANKFISNIDLKTMINLTQGKIYKKSFQSRVNSLDLTPSSFSLYLVFKPETFPYLNYNIYHLKEENSVWTASSCDSKKWPEAYMISFGQSKENQQFADSISVMTYMNFESVKEWENTFNTEIDENDRGKSYQKFKEKHIEILLKELEKKFPKIRSCIQSVYASTPLSYRDYIYTTKGNMYGFQKDSDYALKTFISPKTKTSNLFVTGQSVNMHGIMGTTIGAINTCSRILGREHLISKIKNEVNANEKL